MLPRCARPSVFRGLIDGPVHATALASAVAVMARRESWSEVAHHFRLDWKTVASIVKSAVAFGLKHRPWKPLHIIGVDEVSRKSGHRYLTIVYDLERGRVVWIGEDRKKETLDQFFRWLGPRKRRSIHVVSCDMWAPYAQSIKEYAPQAVIVFDRFHLTHHLLDAVDEVRRELMRRLSGPEKQLIKGIRFVLLKNPWNLTDKQTITLSILVRLNVQLFRAYLLKEAFRQFWNYRSPAWAAAYLKCWLWWASHSRLEPIKQFGRLVKAHLDGILAWTWIRVSNGSLEGINNKIKLISHRSFGFRTVSHYQAAIYHCCADLPLPDEQEI